MTLNRQERVRLAWESRERAERALQWALEAQDRARQIRERLLAAEVGVAATGTDAIDRAAGLAEANRQRALAAYRNATAGHAATGPIRRGECETDPAPP